MPTILPRPQMEGGKGSKVKKKMGEGRDNTSEFLHANVSAYAGQPTCMLHIQPHFSEPLRNHPFSLPEEF